MQPEIGAEGENILRDRFWVYFGFDLLPAVTVCAKVGIGRKVGIKNVFSCKFSVKTASEKKFLTVQGDFS